jgi:hypothetical protein
MLLRTPSDSGIREPRSRTWFVLIFVMAALSDP